MATQTPIVSLSRISYRTLSTSLSHMPFAYYDRLVGISASYSTQYAPENYPNPSFYTNTTPINRLNRVRADGNIYVGGAGNSTQWNTDSSGHPWSTTQGYGFPENRLKDVTLLQGITSVNPNSPTSPYWVHTRSRIKFTIPPWSETASGKVITSVFYKILQWAPSQGVTSVRYDEWPNQPTSLIICPLDEGIKDNEAMVIEIWRQSFDKVTGNLLATSPPMVIFFNTYATPVVNISHPKSITNYKKIANNYDSAYDFSGRKLTLESEGNYILWANDLTSNPFVDTENREDFDWICSAINILFTKDGGDNSNYPIFTRFHISEYKSEYGVGGNFTGTFPKPSNDDIRRDAQGLKGFTKLTATWTGLQLDDGTLIQLSGTQQDGFNWDNLSDQLLTPPSNPTEKRNDDRFIHFVCTGVDNSVSPRKYTYKLDRRLIFRAGYKYLIKIGRFHSSVMGVIGSDPSVPSAWGGNYTYDGATQYPVELVSNLMSSQAQTWLHNNNRNKPRWIGPSMGNDFIELQDTEKLNVIYPGCSKVDYVIVDCCHTMISSNDLITTRPSTQEVGADSWLTFAYRHLSKARGSMDFWVAKSTSGVPYYASAPGEQGRVCDTLRSDGGSTGIPMTTGWEQAWGGADNGVARLAKMYERIVRYIAENAANWIPKLPATGPYHSNVWKKSPQLRVYVDYQGFNDPSITTPPLNAPNIFKNRQIPGPSGPFSGDNIAVPIYEDIDFGVPGTVNYTTDYKPSCCRRLLQNYVNGGSPSDVVPSLNNEIFYNYTNNPSQPKYGNVYKWFPIINAVTNNGKSTLRIKTNSPTPVNENVNRFNLINSGYKEGSGYKGRYIIDNVHHIADVNSYQTNLSANISSGNGTYGVPDKFLEWSDLDGRLYTSQGDGTPLTEYELLMVSNTVDAAYKGNGGTQFFTLNGASCEQLKPGRLYLRVPPTQDCENGDPGNVGQVKRIAVPTRKDAIYPLARASHFLWITVTVFGRVKVVITPGEYEVCECWQETIYDSITGLPTGTILHHEHHDEESDEYNQNNPGALGSIGRTINIDGKSFYNVLTVYGEDNGGLGRCISTDMANSLWYEGDGVSIPKHYGMNNTSATGGSRLDGAIETPLRVRYTPLVQPIITLDNQIINGLSDRTTQNNNVISLMSTVDCNWNNLGYYERGSSWEIPNIKNKTSFSISISYGMFKSAMAGRYITISKNAGTRSENTKNFHDYQRLIDFDDYVNTGTDVTAPKKGEPTNTDIYPTVGICNAFMVLLIPHGAKDSTGKEYEFTKMPGNFFHPRNRSIWEDFVSPENGQAKTVIVSNLHVSSGEIYKQVNITTSNSINDNHKLRTAYNCAFNYTELINTNNVRTSAQAAAISSRNNRLQQRTWYDLVIVPIFTNRGEFASNDAAFPNMNFQYTNGAGTVNGVAYGGGGPVNITDYYGSSPLVVRKFLMIANISLPEPIPNPNYSDNSIFPGGSCLSPPIITNPNDSKNWNHKPAIIFPNVNTKRYDINSGIINESPGFWLNNSFRIIARGPHYRTVSQVSLSGEQSLEIVTGGALQGASQARFFQISDIQIHIGKYDNAFKDISFQNQINNNLNNPSWLNSHGIYSMRYNSNAFSKCTPQQKNDGDSRDIILGGGFDSSSQYYKDRFFEFNPALVPNQYNANIFGASTDYPEGYYIQMRFLNGEYPPYPQQGGQWSSWHGGVLYDYVEDTSLQYCIPVRNYNQIYTSFRQYIKESFPGTELRTLDEETRNIIRITGSGTESPSSNLVQGADRLFTSKEGSIVGNGNVSSSPIVPYKNTPTDNIPENLDYPYMPQIWDERKSGVITGDAANKAFFPIPPNVYNLHQTTWEMSYVDYVIRNMAKLYYSEWTEALIDNGTRLLPEHLGWTHALQNAYNAQTIYNQPWVANTIQNNVNPQSPHIPKPPNPSDTPKCRPVNRNRYFRKPITQQDFDDLLKTLQTMLTFIRSTKYTGAHTPLNDNRIGYTGNNFANGYGTGFSVLPVHPELIEFPRVSSNYTVTGPTGIVQPLRDKNRMKIGHSLNQYDDGSTKIDSQDFNFIDSNYIQQLLNTIISKII